MRPLRTPGRRRLMCTALCACAGSVLLFPAVCRSAFSLPASFALHAGQGRDLELPVLRPAFHIAQVRDPFVAPQRSQQSGAMKGALVVRAVVIGTDPHALIEVSGTLLVVKTGDAVMGTRVAEITQGGLRLATGQIIPLQKEPL